MNINCCLCGIELPPIKAIESEEERKKMELIEGVAVPIIGVLCESCELTSN